MLHKSCNDVGMYVAVIPNRNSSCLPGPRILSRGRQGKERYRGKPSKLPIEQIQLIRRVLKGEKLVAINEAFSILRSLPHGHVPAVLSMAR